MHGRQINPYEISHFARCNTLVLISITHSIQCNYAFYPKGGVAQCTQARAAAGRAREGERRGWAIDRGLALSCIPKIWQFMWSASAISISDKVGVPRKLLNTFWRKRQRERDVERDANWNRVTAPALATASGRSPASLPRRVSNFLAPGLGSVLCALVWFGSVLNFN